MLFNKTFMRVVVLAAALHHFWRTPSTLTLQVLKHSPTPLWVLQLFKAQNIWKPTPPTSRWGSRTASVISVSVRGRVPALVLSYRTRVLFSRTQTSLQAPKTLRTSPRLMSGSGRWWKLRKNKVRADVKTDSSKLTERSHFSSRGVCLQ